MPSASQVNTNPIPEAPFIAYDDKNGRKRRCLGLHVEVFYPLKYSPRAVAEARAFCGACDFQGACAQWAIEQGEPDGIWGGSTPDERRAIRAAR